MAVTQSICISFRSELVQAIHDFSDTGDTFMMALYTSDATLNADTTAYTSTEEITGTGYDAGGKVLTSLGVSVSNGTTVIDFADVSWEGAEFTAYGALIYNATKDNRSVLVLNFGYDHSVSSQTFTVSFPVPDPSNAILRLQ